MPWHQRALLSVRCQPPPLCRYLGGTATGDIQPSATIPSSSVAASGGAAGMAATFTSPLPAGANPAQLPLIFAAGSLYPDGYMRQHNDYSAGAVCWGTGAQAGACLPDERCGRARRLICGPLPSFRLLRCRLPEPADGCPDRRRARQPAGQRDAGGEWVLWVSALPASASHASYLSAARAGLPTLRSHWPTLPRRRTCGAC